MESQKELSLPNVDEEVLGDTSTLADPGVVTQLIDSYGQ